MQGFGEDPEILEAASCRDVFNHPAKALWIQPNPPYLMCHNNPTWQEILKKRAKEHIDAGVDAIHIDEMEGIAGHLYLYGLCDFCVNGFRKYLKERFTPQELRDKFGIADIEQFNYRDYLLGKGAVSAVFDPNVEQRAEFVKFQMISRKKQVEELINYAKDYAKSQGKTIKFSGNSYFFSANKQPLAQLLDLFVFENMMFIPRLNGKWIGLYFLAHQFLRRWPVVMFPDIMTLFLLPEDDWQLFIHWLAEATATRSSFMIPYHAYTFGGGEYHIEAEEIAPYTNFFIEQSKKFWDAEPLANIAILYDYRGVLHDYIYEGFATPFYGGGYTHDAFLGTSLALVESHMPFDVVYSGDGELIKKPLKLSELKDFPCVIAPPSSERPSELQELLKRYEAIGGKVVYLDEWPINYWRSPNKKELRAKVIEQVLSANVASIIDTGAGDQLGLVPAATGDSLLLHVINYDYDFSLHDFLPSESFDACISVPEDFDISSKELWLYTFDASPRKIEFEIEDEQVCFTVPSVKIYEILVWE